MSTSHGSVWPNASHKKQTVGDAGEHYVLAMLLREGFIAAQAPRGLKDIDVLAHHPVTGNTCALQVKTKSSGKKWVLGRKHERIDHQLVFALVDFVASPPAIYVLPSFHVARAIRLDHWCWKYHGGNDGSMRFISDPMTYQCGGTQPGWLEPYCNNWDPVNVVTAH